MLAKFSSFIKDHYHTKYYTLHRRAKALFIFDIILLGLITAVVAGTALYFIFREPPSILVISSVESEEIIQAGVPATITVTLTNPSDGILQDVELLISPPSNIELDESRGTLFAVGDLSPGTSTDVSFPVTFWGASEDVVRVPLSTTSLTSDEKIDRAHGVIVRSIETGAINMTVLTPEILFEGQLIAPSIQLENALRVPIDEVHVRIDDAVGVSPHFIFEGAGVIGTLRSETELSPQPLRLQGDTLSFHVITSMRLSNGTEVDLARTPVSQNIEPLEISFATEIEIIDRAVSQTDTIPVRLIMNNGTPHELNDVSFSFISSSNCLAFAGKNARGSTIHIPLSQHTNLSVLERGSYVESLPLSVRVECTAQSMRIDTIMSFSLGTNNQRIEIPGSSFTIDTVSTPLLSTEARYYTEDGDQLGRGPWPVEQSKHTKLWVFVEMGSNLGAILSPTFSATLAPGVSWTGRSSVSFGSPVTYDALLNTVSWQDTLLQDGDRRAIGFEVSITPSSTQQTLMNDAVLTGEDRASSKHISTQPISLSL